MHQSASHPCEVSGKPQARIQQQHCEVFSDWQIIIICEGFIPRRIPSRETLLQNTDGDATGAGFERISGAAACPFGIETHQLA